MNPSDEANPSSLSTSAPHSAVTTTSEDRAAAFTPDTAVEGAAAPVEALQADAAAGAHEPLLASLFTALVSRVVQVCASTRSPCLPLPCGSSTLTQGA